MRKAAQIGIIGLGALGACLAAVVPGALSAGAAAEAREPLCRRPAALPPLPPEPQVRDSQQRRDPAREFAAPLMMAPPPPPPPPPPMMAPEPAAPPPEA